MNLRKRVLALLAVLLVASPAFASCSVYLTQTESRCIDCAWYNPFQEKRQYRTIKWYQCTDGDTFKRTTTRTYDCGSC